MNKGAKLKELFNYLMHRPENSGSNLQSLEDNIILNYLIIIKVKDAIKFLRLALLNLQN